MEQAFARGSSVFINVGSKHVQQESSQGLIKDPAGKVQEDTEN
jgi:hypothetical protein